MALPALTASTSLRGSALPPIGVAGPVSTNVSPASLLDSAKNIGKCAAKCGGNALSCIRCGTDIGCWVECAGPSTVSCLVDCF